MREALTPILGKDVTDVLEDWWGIDEEGELKGAYKPSGRKYLITRAIYRNICSV